MTDKSIRKLNDLFALMDHLWTYNHDAYINQSGIQKAIEVVDKRITQKLKKLAGDDSQATEGENMSTCVPSGEGWVVNYNTPEAAAAGQALQESAKELEKWTVMYPPSELEKLRSQEAHHEAPNVEPYEVENM